MGKLISSRTTTSALAIFGVTLVTFAFQNCAPFRPTALKKTQASFDLSTSFKKCVPKAPEARAEIHRLNNNEYMNTILDLFNVAVPAHYFPSGDIKGGSGYSNDSAQYNSPNILTNSFVQDYFTIAAKVAKKIMDENPNSVLGLGCAQETDTCYDQIVSRLARRVFRRPLGHLPGDPTLAIYRSLIKKDTDKKSGVTMVLTALLASSNFLYRSYGAFTNTDANKVRLDRYEVASRLSFFLWGSTPDLELLDSDLTNPDILRPQVERMFNDVRIRRLASTFGKEWTGYDSISFTPLPEDFNVDDGIRAPAAEETREFLNHVFTNSNRLLDTLDADYTFLNDELASFYNVPGVVGPQFRLVSGLGDQRGGLISQMSTLIGNNSGDVDTHPVRRGIWITTQVMCIETPDKPMDVDVDEVVRTAKNPRELSNFHASQLSCKGCHYLMDPIGLGLENYDGIGQWRTSYTISPRWGGRNLAVDPDGNLEGVSFNSPRQLKRIIASDPRTFACLSGNILKYSLGRDLSPKDHCVSEDIGEQVIGKDGSFKEVVQRIVFSDSFLMGGK